MLISRYIPGIPLTQNRANDSVCCDQSTIHRTGVPFSSLIVHPAHIPSRNLDRDAGNFTFANNVSKR